MSNPWQNYNRPHTDGIQGYRWWIKEYMPQITQPTQPPPPPPPLHSNKPHNLPQQYGPIRPNIHSAVQKPKTFIQQHQHADHHFQPHDHRHHTTRHQWHHKHKQKTNTHHSQHRHKHQQIWHERHHHIMWFDIQWSFQPSGIGRQNFTIPNTNLGAEWFNRQPGQGGEASTPKIIWVRWRHCWGMEQKTVESGKVYRTCTYKDGCRKCLLESDRKILMWSQRRSRHGSWSHTS